MPFNWPNYESEALGDGRTWSGTFESFEQRNDVAYYEITIHDGGRGDWPPFTVAVGTGLIPDSEFGKPDFPATLREYVVLVAKEGHTNIT
jgi:hypothetical protein